eukprot:SAG31_NODE_13097_length_892_cov_1.900378_2_plen_89_part_00
MRCRIFGERLGYVDDVAVLEADRDLREAVDVAGERASEMSMTCRVKADQSMNPGKCVNVSAGFGVIPGSEDSLMRIGEHGLGGLIAFS